MFIRNTTKLDRKTGNKYTSYQLVEAYRTKSGPRQKILLTVSSDVILSPIERKELANRIEEIVSGHSQMLPSSEQIEVLDQHFANLLLQKK